MRDPTRARGLTGWLFGMALVGLLIFAVLHFGDVAAFGRALRRAQPWWLIAALVLQALTYVSLSLGWSAVLNKAGASRPLSRLIPIPWQSCSPTR